VQKILAKLSLQDLSIDFSKTIKLDANDRVFKIQEEREKNEFPKLREHSRQHKLSEAGKAISLIHLRAFHRRHLCNLRNNASPSCNDNKSSAYFGKSDT